MCFIIDTPRQKATEDIRCWKILSGNGSPYFQVLAPPYVIGQKNPPIRLRPAKGFLLTQIGSRMVPTEAEQIDKGYHSYATLAKAKHELKTYTRGLYFHVRNPSICPEILVEFVIPRGAVYYYNHREREYVSSRIIRVS